MSDEPENHTIRLLQDMRVDQAAFQKEVMIALAALSADLKATKEKVFEMDDRLMIVEGRLNGIDGRLARIEKYTGLVKA